jgi:hypothetical protein
VQTQREWTAIYAMEQQPNVALQQLRLSHTAEPPDIDFMKQSPWGYCPYLYGPKKGHLA